MSRSSSYGHVLFGLVVLTACAVIAYQRGWCQTVAAVLVGAGAVIMVAAVHLALGFNWMTGLHELRVRYYQGIAAQRPQPLLGRLGGPPPGRLVGLSR